MSRILAQSLFSDLPGNLCVHCQHSWHLSLTWHKGVFSQVPGQNAPLDCLKAKKWTLYGLGEGECVIFITGNFNVVAFFLEMAILAFFCLVKAPSWKGADWMRWPLKLAFSLFIMATREKRPPNSIELTSPKAQVWQRWGSTLAAINILNFFWPNMSPRESFSVAFARPFLLKQTNKYEKIVIRLVNSTFYLETGLVKNCTWFKNNRGFTGLVQHNRVCLAL